MVQDWDKALWELVLASQKLDLPDRLVEINIPTLVVTGDDDRIVPTEESLRLGAELPDAQTVVINDCGHVPHEECSETFLEAVSSYLDEHFMSVER
jgi:pimeloyl-ACP methyl ester carboxylesterase